MSTETELAAVWRRRLELWAEGTRIRAEGDKLRAEGARIRAEGDILRAEGANLRAEGDNLWAEAIIKAHGNVTMRWEYVAEKRGNRCILETGEVFEP